ncbi:unnamed protein product [Toxocara canis]|uniref:Transposase n=1 Tax=Toxocara canis TaxID=6265 RepID=A0A183VB32_TOXCA|nr:unnamed protein product [Toxocara canis]
MLKLIDDVHMAPTCRESTIAGNNHEIRSISVILTDVFSMIDDTHVKYFALKNSRIRRNKKPHKSPMILYAMGVRIISIIAFP